MSNVSIRNSTFRDCVALGCVFSDIDVDGFLRRGRLPLILWGSVFRHVALRGKIGMFKLGRAPEWMPPPAAYLTAWLDANGAFYDAVDWALDISKAEFTFMPDLHFVPGHLVRRDPNSQLLVTREQARLALELPPAGSSTRVALSWFLSDGPYGSTVLVAAKGSPSYARELASFDVIRQQGLAT